MPLEKFGWALQWPHISDAIKGSNIELESCLSGAFHFKGSMSLRTWTSRGSQGLCKKTKKILKGLSRLNSYSSYFCRDIDIRVAIWYKKLLYHLPSGPDYATFPHEEIKIKTILNCKTKNSQNAKIKIAPSRIVWILNSRWVHQSWTFFGSGSLEFCFAPKHRLRNPVWQPSTGCS